MNRNTSHRRSTLASSLAAGILIAAVSASAGAQADAAAQEGAQLFQQYCVSCHKLGGGRLVGPDLKGVTERRSQDWIVRFVSDPERMRKDDPIAIANLKEFGIPMPNLGLSAQQVNALVAYFKAGQAAPAGTPDQYVPTLVLSLIAVAALTWIGLAAGSKKAHGGMA